MHLAGPSGVSTLTFNSPGTQKFRFGTIPGVPNWGAETINARYSSGWHLDDTSVNGWFFKLDGRGGNTAGENNGLWLFRIPNGPNPHSDEVPLFGVTNGHGYTSRSRSASVSPGARARPQHSTFRAAACSPVT